MKDFNPPNLLVFPENQLKALLISFIVFFFYILLACYLWILSFHIYSNNISIQSFVLSPPSSMDHSSSVPRIEWPFGDMALLNLVNDFLYTQSAKVLILFLKALHNLALACCLLPFSLHPVNHSFPRLPLSGRPGQLPALWILQTFLPRGLCSYCSLCLKPTSHMYIHGTFFTSLRSPNLFHFVALINS